MKYVALSTLILLFTLPQPARAAYDVKLPPIVLSVRDMNGKPVECVEANVVFEDLRKRWGNCGYPPFFWIPCRVSHLDTAKIVKIHTDAQGEGRLPFTHLKSRRLNRKFFAITISTYDFAALEDVKKWYPDESENLTCQVRVERREAVEAMPTRIDCKMPISREEFYQHKFGGTPSCNTR